jgi:hypothetical protein
VTRLRILGRVLAHLAFLAVGMCLIALDAWEDLTYQLKKALR